LLVDTSIMGTRERVIAHGARFSMIIIISDFNLHIITILRLAPGGRFGR
jgi:hypothetical protein